ncbi:hypothetical protein GP486_007529 [Trichoglossum hirsutum]|uniref:Heterokaryon incompatibility domain-containing protein n=1 Tax=Trichoglossum hirsutum TaxID=265104 RepID=A0A9P8IHE5_9PEZI|nr:hypothetical protein GP486_007529 [Trichoglossum hirsutum]
MEHLIYDPPARKLRREIRAAWNSTLSVLDWPAYEKDYGTCLQLSPGFSWFGHDHPMSSYYHLPDCEDEPTARASLDLYGLDWDIEGMTNSGDIRSAHSSLETVDLPEAIHRTAAFIQAWLYFGFLESICFRAIPTSYMVRTNLDGQECLYSRMLPILLEVWIRRLSQLEDDSKQEMLYDARDCAGRANSIQVYILNSLSKSDACSPFSELRMLVLSFSPALSALFEAVAGMAEVHLRTEVRSIPAPQDACLKPYFESLVQKGWCRFVIASAEIAMSPSFLRFVDVANFANTSQGHDTCSIGQCNRNHVEEKTYTPVHWPRDCCCQYIKPDINTIRDILDCGYIPVVRYIAASESLEVCGIHPEERKDYVAFSHVWADGLGSTTEVGLPSCQIRRLDQLAGQRAKKAAFWIDGLCVPKDKPYRKKAINLMKYTYQNASGVLVLDEGLRKLSTTDSDLEIGWSVIASGWFGRLWTYEEGFLPPWVEIEIRDGLIDLYQLTQRLYKIMNHPRPTPMSHVFVRDLVAMLQKVRPLDRRHRERPISKRLVDTFNALTRRQSSRPDDQLLVIGLLLDLDIDSLPTPSGEDKWMAFYMSLGKIPWTVVFDQRPKMQVRPFTWAPSSWISSGKDEWLHYEEELAEITDEGLRIHLTILMLDDICSTKASAVIVDTGQDRYELERQDKLNDPKIQAFNVVFVRHFQHEHPRDALQRNRSSLLEVGLGLRDESAAPKIEHDFCSSWAIWAMDESDDAPQHVEDVVPGRWGKADLCFE